jgi:hypothetical protein
MATAAMAPPSTTTAAAPTQAGAAGGGKQSQADIVAILKKSGMRALGGGISGAAAMGINVGALMWLRTVRGGQGVCVCVGGRGFGFVLRGLVGWFIDWLVGLVALWGGFVGWSCE